MSITFLSFKLIYICLLNNIKLLIELPLYRMYFVHRQMIRLLKSNKIEVIEILLFF